MTHLPLSCHSINSFVSAKRKSKFPNVFDFGCGCGCVGEGGLGVGGVIAASAKLKQE